MRTIGLLLVAVLAALQPPREYRPVPFPRVDEAIGNPPLLAFRDRLNQIIRRQSLDDLMAVVERGAAMEARGGRPDRFRRDFESRGDFLWVELQRALALGGAFTTSRGAKVGRREFCAPYVYTTFPSTLPDYIGGEEMPWAITGQAVTVRSRPSAGAGVVARLSYVLVEFASEGPHPVLEPGKPRELGWVNVSVTADRFGWVSQLYARSPSDWHVCLVAGPDGSWRISEFVQGDPTAER
jgi:hypothetical protein